ncbi:hypothetical protein Baya_8608 [Bagarius yarrelli]|uniref:Uncharacterized protein n=1 Tax=Bagarius yarrelli TaxID=175774 RepID=A0A556U4F8_BAGYA|nr:hypothetical protein Baya_8608 [Bagarius yarrelli]
MAEEPRCKRRKQANPRRKNGHSLAFSIPKPKMKRLRTRERKGERKKEREKKTREERQKSRNYAWQGEEQEVQEEPRAIQLWETLLGLYSPLSSAETKLPCVPWIQMALVNLPFQAGKITGLDAISFSSFTMGQASLLPLAASLARLP